MEKRYIVPLPGLVTTDGQQQYLSNKAGKWFASRRDERLRQTWKEEHLGYIPGIYRQFAVEVEDSEEEKMEERNKIFGFVLRDGRAVEGSVLSRFQDIKDLEQIKAEAMDSDFITVVNQYGNRAILSKYQIIYVEEL